MKAFRAPTMTILHEKLTDYIVNASVDQLDVITSADVQIHNVIAQADSMAWEFDLKDLWLTPSRWSMMAKQYIDGEELQAWLDKITKHIGTKGRGIALMRTRVVKPRGGPEKGNKETRRWGSCMVAISYKAKPKPQITLYSRTCYLGYLSGLDLTVAWMCGRYVAHELGIKVEDIQFVWMNEALQYHNFKSMAYLFNHPDKTKRLQYRRWIRMTQAKLEEREEWEGIAERPAIQLTRKWMSNMLDLDEQGKTLGDMSYNTYRRIRRRYHTEVLGYERAQEFEGWSYHKRGEQAGQPKEFFKAYLPLPNTPITKLDFRVIGMPFGKRYGAEFEGEIEEDDDDE